MKSPMAPPRMTRTRGFLGSMLVGRHSQYQQQCAIGHTGPHGEIPAPLFGQQPGRPVPHEEGHADKKHAADDPGISQDGEQQAGDLRLQKGGRKHWPSDQEHEGAEGSHGQEFLHIHQHQDEADGHQHEEPFPQKEEFSHVHVAQAHHAPEEANAQEDGSPGIITGEGFEKGFGFGFILPGPEMGGEQSQG